MQYNSNNRWSENFQILIDKIGFLMLFKTFFRTILAFLEAEIFRFFMLQMARNTLYLQEKLLRNFATSSLEVS